MMVSNVRLDAPAKLSNRSGQVSAPNWMSLHEHALLRGEPASLAEKRRKVLVNFANIMKECGCPYLIDMFGMQTEFASNLARILSDAYRMTGGIGVSSLNGFHHELEQLSIHPLNLEVHLVHVA